MTHSRLWAAAGIIALVILVGFVLSVPHTKDVGQTAAPRAAKAGVPSVTLHDAYKKGVHTLSGTVMASDACTTVSASATTTAAASSTSIALSLNVPADSGICLELPTPLSFSTAVAAPPGAIVTVTVNGVIASTTSS